MWLLASASTKLLLLIMPMKCLRLSYMCKNQRWTCNKNSTDENSPEIKNGKHHHDNSRLRKIHYTIRPPKTRLIVTFQKFRQTWWKSWRLCWRKFRRCRGPFSSDPEFRMIKIKIHYYRCLPGALSVDAWRHRTHAQASFNYAPIEKWSTLLERSNGSATRITNYVELWW